IIENWFAQIWKNCSHITLKELYSAFSTKGVPIVTSTLPQVPNNIQNSLTSIFNLANQKMTARQQIYMYFSLVHMAQNRIYGSSDNDEYLSHVMNKKLIKRGGIKMNKKYQVNLLVPNSHFISSTEKEWLIEMKKHNPNSYICKTKEGNQKIIQVFNVSSIIFDSKLKTKIITDSTRSFFQNNDQYHI